MNLTVLSVTNVLNNVSSNPTNHCALHKSTTNCPSAINPTALSKPKTCVSKVLARAIVYVALKPHHLPVVFQPLLFNM